MRGKKVRQKNHEKKVRAVLKQTLSHPDFQKKIQFPKKLQQKKFPKQNLYIYIYIYLYLLLNYENF